MRLIFLGILTNTSRWLLGRPLLPRIALMIALFVLVYLYGWMDHEDVDRRRNRRIREYERNSPDRSRRT